MAERITVAISKTAHEMLRKLIEIEDHPRYMTMTLGNEIEFLISQRLDYLEMADTIQRTRKRLTEEGNKQE